MFPTFWYFSKESSDFHKLIYTVLKMYNAKQKPWAMKYRIYKKFANDKFRRDILKELSFTNLQED